VGAPSGAHGSVLLGRPGHFHSGPACPGCGRHSLNDDGTVIGCTGGPPCRVFTYFPRLTDKATWAPHATAVYGPTCPGCDGPGLWASPDLVVCVNRSCHVQDFLGRAPT